MEPGARPLRILCLHGHGGQSSKLCQNLSEHFFRSIGAARVSTHVASRDLVGAATASVIAARVKVEEELGAAQAESGLSVECRCVDAPFPAPQRPQRPLGRLWWRYNDDDKGDRPEDWAEMEVATTRLAQELEAWPCDGLLGFSQGAEMVHTVAVLSERGDPRFLSGTPMPRFLVSLSGAVNPAHFEAPGGGGPARGCTGPRVGPEAGGVRLPCLFVGDFDADGWYPSSRFEETLGLYKDATVVRHAQGHRVPVLSGEAASSSAGFFERFFGRSAFAVAQAAKAE